MMLAQFHFKPGALRESLRVSFALEFRPCAAVVSSRHRLFCVDETSAMRDSVRGEHTSLVPLNILRMNCPSWNGRVISVGLSGTGTQPILLQRDSGSDDAILYPGSGQPEVQALVHAATLHNGLLPSFRCRICRSATVSLATSRS